MRAFLLILTIFSMNAFAGFDKLTVQNLDLDYLGPYGKGTVERVGIGMSLATEPYDIEVNRTDDAFELTSPYLDFTWNHPLKFVHEIEKLNSKKLSANLGTKKSHFVEADYLMVQPKGRGQYIAEKLKGNCEGIATGTFQMRMLDDCRNKMDLTIKRVDVPVDFILFRILEDLPRMPAPEMDFPGDNIVVSVKVGDYALQIYMKYWFYAGLRSWGHVQYENDYKTVAIRVDQIKFGYLNVTKLVMNKLKEVVTSPNVKVDPPWIRINIEGLNETQSH